ncbi:hypothetical protein VTN77DRAFT_48 [Rasamsonia byssochlamydoides]|uniref:uncharacterized protein n=1 Tax=Rasamsonia byssochlamydoides TaxID=89139 RepID=UPI0037425C07
MSSGRKGRELPREVLISKAMSNLLRHSAEKENVKISPEGYVNVADLLAWRKLKSLKATFPEILDAVANSDKKRFSLLYVPPAAAGQQPRSEGKTQELAVQTANSEEKQENATAHALSVKDTDPSHFLIRATQGHSMKSVDTTLFLERLTLADPEDKSAPPLPDTVVHGTYHGAWPLILASGGLKSMGRTQVHFATGPSLDEVLPNGRQGPTAKLDPDLTKQSVISGMRSDAQILIYIDLKKALAAGCPFYRSENGVILSEGIDVVGKENEDKSDETKQKVVPLEFFDVVVERKVGLGILWENGRVVQELPAELASKKNPKGVRVESSRRGRGGKR